MGFGRHEGFGKNIPKQEQKAPLLDIDVADVEHVSLELRNRMQEIEAKEEYKKAHPDALEPSSSEALMEFVTSGKAEVFGDNFDREFGPLGSEALKEELKKYRRIEEEPGNETLH